MQRESVFEAYLDIETTGLSWLYADITFVGIYSVMVVIVGLK